MFQEKLKNKKNEVEKYLGKYVKEDSTYKNIINEAMAYSVFAGGKRLRPILMLAANELVGGSEEEVYPFACTIELIHTYSLIHDDLPAMDNDDYRRGRLTNHKVYGEALAILSGDGLLNLAYEIMISECIKDNSINKLKATKVIANSAGIQGMIGGQVVDIISEGKNINQDTVDFINQNKTGELIKASIVAGAMIGGANNRQIKLLTEYAHYLGLAFQIRDDILDVISTTNKLGKPVKSDVKNGKNNYVSINGVEKSEEYVKQLSKKAIECLDEFQSEKSKFLKEITTYLINREY